MHALCPLSQIETKKYLVLKAYTYISLFICLRGFMYTYNILMFLKCFPCPCFNNTNKTGSQTIK